MNTDDYYNATPEERVAMVASIKPPTARSHRGKPRSPEMDGYHEATKARRTPTHRLNVPAVMPARMHAVLHLLERGQGAR